MEIRNGWYCNKSQRKRKAQSQEKQVWPIVNVSVSERTKAYAKGKAPKQICPLEKEKGDAFWRLQSYKDLVEFWAITWGLTCQTILYQKGIDSCNQDIDYALSEGVDCCWTWEKDSRLFKNFNKSTWLFASARFYRENHIRIFGIVKDSFGRRLVHIRIVLSGTPIQNNLREMWALFDFCCPNILGDKKDRNCTPLFLRAKPLIGHWKALH